MAANEGSLLAGRTSNGKIDRAEKGTILLDEITEMPLSVQSRLMEILQDKVWWRPGNEPAASVDVRILAATSASIDRALAEKRLREDLYYRLSAFTVQVPSLRQRKSEIAVLLQHLMHRLSKHYALPAREFSPAVLSACQQYSWPGNVRELEKFVKRYLVAGDAESILNDLKSGRMDTSSQKSDDSTSHDSIVSDARRTGVAISEIAEVPHPEREIGSGKKRDRQRIAEDRMESQSGSASSSGQLSHAALQDRSIPHEFSGYVGFAVVG